jgi:hypothetical protein
MRGGASRTLHAQSPVPVPVPPSTSLCCDGVSVAPWRGCPSGPADSAPVTTAPHFRAPAIHTQTLLRLLHAPVATDPPGVSTGEAWGAGAATQRSSHGKGSMGLGVFWAEFWADRGILGGPWPKNTSRSLNSSPKGKNKPSEKKGASEVCVEGGQVCVDGGMREGCGAAASPSVPSVPSTCMHWRTLASSGPCAPLALNVSRLRVCPMMRPCWPPRYDFLPHHLHCWAARRPRRFLRPPSPHAPTPPSHAVMSRCAAVLGRGEGSQGPLGLGWEMGWLITAGACCCCCASQGLTIVHRPTGGLGTHTPLPLHAHCAPNLCTCCYCRATAPVVAVAALACVKPVLTP